MERRLPLAAVAAGGGMLAAAFLSTAVAVADTGSSDSADGLFAGLLGDGGSSGIPGSEDAFTAPDDLTFDPGSDGYDDVGALFGISPLLEIGGGSIGTEELVESLTSNIQDSDYADTSINELISSLDINTDDTVGTVLLDDILDQDAISIDAGDIIGGLGSLVGEIDIDADAIDSVVSSVVGVDGPLTVSDLLDEVGIGGDTTLGEAIDGLDLAENAPELLGDSIDLASQDLDVYGADGDEIGTADTSVYTSNIMGIESTQFTVTGTEANTVDDASSDDISSALGDFGDDDFAGGSSVDTVSQVLAANDATAFFGGGEEDGVSADDVDSALSDAGISFDGDVSAEDIANALVDAGDQGTFEASLENFGDFGDDDFENGDLSDAAQALADNDVTIGDDASADDVSSALDEAGISIDGDTSAADIAEALNTDLDPIGSIALALEDFSDDAFTSDADPSLDDAASALADGESTDVLGDDVSDAEVSNALGAEGITTDGDTSTGDIADALNGADVSGADELPADGTVYSITDIGFGIQNFYEATPDEDGSGASDIQDVLVTPLGNIDLSTEFDAISDLAPGNSVAGVDGSTGGDLFGGLFDGLFGWVDDLFGDAGGDDGADAVNDDASADEIESVLDNVDVDGDLFDDASNGDAAEALAGDDSTDVLGGDVSGSDVSDALGDISFEDGDNFDAQDLADALNDAGGSGGESDGLFGGLFDGFDDIFGGDGEDGGLGDVFGGLF